MEWGPWFVVFLQGPQTMAHGQLVTISSGEADDQIASIQQQSVGIIEVERQVRPGKSRRRSVG
jgi:hypothetical protein